MAPVSITSEKMGTPRQAWRSRCIMRVGCPLRASGTVRASLPLSEYVPAMPASSYPATRMRGSSQTYIKSTRMLTTTMTIAAKNTTVCTTA